MEEMNEKNQIPTSRELELEIELAFREGRIRIADQDQVELYSREVSEIMGILQAAGALVTDLSTLDLFPTSWDRLERIGKLARISAKEVVNLQYIWRVAQKIHDYRH